MAAFAFTDAQKVDIRRFCGYNSIGDGDSSFNAFRFFQAWGLLEYRMSHGATDEGPVVLNHLTNCAALEEALYGSSANLDTGQAAVWHWNKNEVRDRKRLYDMCRRELCNFLGLPPGPGLNTGSLTLVV